jgi:hypothetical protein
MSLTCSTTTLVYLSQTFFADFDGFVIVDESDLPKEIDEVKFAGDKAHDDFTRRFRLRKR